MGAEKWEMLRASVRRILQGPQGLVLSMDSEVSIRAYEGGFQVEHAEVPDESLFSVDFDTAFDHWVKLSKMAPEQERYETCVSWWSPG